MQGARTRSTTLRVETSADSELSQAEVSPAASLDGYLGFTRDEVARYMWGYGGSVAAARKAMKTTYVSRSLPSFLPSFLSCFCPAQGCPVHASLMHSGFIL